MIEKNEKFIERLKKSRKVCNEISTVFDRHSLSIGDAVFVLGVMSHIVAGAAEKPASEITDVVVEVAAVLTDIDKGNEDLAKQN